MVIVEKKREHGVYTLLYKINCIIIVLLVVLPTILIQPPLLTFIVISIYTGVSFGVSFLLLNLYGFLRLKRKRVMFLLVGCGTMIWVIWSLMNVIKGVNLP